MVRNAFTAWPWQGARHGRATVGVLNLDGAASAQRAMARLAERGYPITFAGSVRADGGSLLRGNDLLAGGADICVCDTLTGNVLMKLFSAFTTGGGYEAVGWGYGPSVGEGWGKVVSIISRASGAPVIANALCYTAALIRGGLVRHVETELNAARSAGLDTLIASFAPPPAAGEEVAAPARQPTDSEIQGIDVLAVEEAVKSAVESGDLRGIRYGMHRACGQGAGKRCGEGQGRIEQGRLSIAWVRRTGACWLSTRKI